MRNENMPAADSALPHLVPRETRCLHPPLASTQQSCLKLPTMTATRARSETPALLPGSGGYERNWSQVIIGSTSGLVFVMVIAVFYALYVLCLPYWNSISFGILLSIVLHPKSRELGSDSNAAREVCAMKMRTMQRAWAAHSNFSGTLGSILSLQHFFSYALLQGALCLGLDKVYAGFLHKLVCDAEDTTKCRSRSRSRSGNGAVGVDKNNAKINEGNPKSSPMFISTGFCMLRLLTACIFCIVAHSMIGISFFLGMHMVIFALFAVAVVLMQEEPFVLVMWRLWRVAMILFFVIALSYSLALDVLFISDAVKRTTSAVVHVQHHWTNKGYEEGDTNTSGTLLADEETAPSFSIAGLQEMALTKLQQAVMEDLTDALNCTNVTDLALSVHQVLSPMASMFPWQITSAFLTNQSLQLNTSSFTAGRDSLLKTDWVGVAQKLAERWHPLFALVTQFLQEQGSKVVGLFDSIYGLILFVLVARYLLQQDHTILYYVVEKMLKVSNPSGGECHARRIEREITASFFSLLQSFWHLACFQFCATFCLFNLLSFPTPFLCGVASSLTAVLPLIPKWLSPSAFALMYTFTQAASNRGIFWAAADMRVWSCLIAFMASYLNEPLLRVSRGLREDSSVREAVAVEREQVPRFVVGTAVVLGYVNYGVRGILLGPMTVIVAKVLFDNWDMMLEAETDAAPRRQSKQTPLQEEAAERPTI